MGTTDPGSSVPAEVDSDASARDAPFADLRPRFGVDGLDFDALSRVFVDSASAFALDLVGCFGFESVDFLSVAAPDDVVD